jgi:hypothetical protein
MGKAEGQIDVAVHRGLIDAEQNDLKQLHQRVLRSQDFIDNFDAAKMGSLYTWLWTGKILGDPKFKTDGKTPQSDVHQRSSALDSIILCGVLSEEKYPYQAFRLPDQPEIRAKVAPLLVDLKPEMLLDDDKVIQADNFANKQVRKALFEKTKIDLDKIGVAKTVLDQLDINSKHCFQNVLEEVEKSTAEKLDEEEGRILVELVDETILNNYNPSNELLRMFDLLGEAVSANNDNMIYHCNKAAYLLTAELAIKNASKVPASPGASTVPTSTSISYDHKRLRLHEFETGSRPANLVYLESWIDFLKNVS